VFTFTALYAKPNDAEAFEAYYREHHMSIVARWPGVQGTRVVRFTGTPRGTEAPFHLMFEADFASQDDFMAAMGSDAGKETQQDARTMVERFGVELTMMVGEEG
jgi:uncharacterized protein (TIGR02118 family)